MFFNNLLKRSGNAKSIFNQGNHNQISHICLHWENYFFFFNNYLFSLLNQILSMILEAEKKKCEYVFINNFFGGCGFFNINFFFLVSNCYLLSNQANFFFFCFFVKQKKLCSNNFFFFKYFYNELIKERGLSQLVLPKKKKIYTVLRSPFIFKKGREQFEIGKKKAIVNYNFLYSNHLFEMMSKYNKKKVMMKHRYSFISK